jgi:prokaryotic ubiquitin-like protein Pup
MPEREQKKKPAPKERATETEEVEAAPGKQAEALKEELDDLLDEIDSVLESNAEEFVRSYVQKGGE